MDKRDKDCLTCEGYLRCSPLDRARGQPCSDYKRYEKAKKKGNKYKQQYIHIREVM